MYRIIIDAMGGDNAPQAVIEGTLLALKEYDDISVVFTGKEEVIKGCLEGQEYDTSRVEIIDAREEIEMAESPVAAVRTKKDSSMVVGMKMAAEGKGDVFITAGSTGAAVAGGVPSNSMMYPSFPLYIEKREMISFGTSFSTQRLSF